MQIYRGSSKGGHSFFFITVFKKKFISLLILQESAEKTVQYFINSMNSLAFTSA